MKALRLIALGALAAVSFADAAPVDCDMAHADTDKSHCAAPSSAGAAPGKGGYRVWKKSDSPVCRAFTNYLDKLPESERSLACGIDTRLAGFGITAPAWVELKLSEEALAKVTAGLGLLKIRSLLQGARQDACGRSAQVEIAGKTTHG